MKTNSNLQNPQKRYYVYTPADGNESGMYLGYTLAEAKRVARLYAENFRSAGLRSDAYVNLRTDCTTVWSAS